MIMGFEEFKQTGTARHENCDKWYFINIIGDVGPN